MATANDLRALVVQTLRSQIGYTSGNYNYSKFGKASTWRSKWLGGVTEWQGMYCGRFASWGPDKVMGARAAQAAIGLQGYALPAGWAATWLELAWAKRRGRLVNFKDAKPADRIIFKLPGRPLNPSNHIGTFVRWHIPGKVMVVVEGNLPRPGYGNATIGVWEHYRDATYVVGVHSPDYEAAARIYNEENPEEEEMSSQEFKELKALLQNVHDDVDSLRGERTKAHVKEDAKLDRLLKSAENQERQLNTVGRIAKEARELARNVPERLVAFRVPFVKGTAAHKSFGDHFRFGGLQAYAAMAFWRRNEQTQEILKAIDEIDYNQIDTEIHIEEEA